MESLLMKTILTLKVTINQVKMKKFLLVFFCRLFSCVLILRPRKTYIYVFQVMFKFFKFKASFCGFWRLEVNSLHFTLNFEEIKWDFCRLYVLVSCCVANQYSGFTDIFWIIQTEKHILRVNKSKITDENTFYRYHFDIKGSHESSK